MIPKPESVVALTEVALQQMPSGIFLPANAVRSSFRVVLDVTHHGDGDIPELVQKIASIQLKFPYVKPVFLISALDPGELSRAGFIYETVVPEASWDEEAMGGSYQDYKERRFHEMIVVYRAHKMGSIRPGEAVPRWMYER